VLPSELRFDQGLEPLLESFSLLLQPCMRYVLELNRLRVELGCLLPVTLHVLSARPRFKHVEDVLCRHGSHTSDPFDGRRRLLLFFEARYIYLREVELLLCWLTRLFLGL